MRVLYVVSYYRPAVVYGGPVHSIAVTCEALAARGVEVTVLTTDANGAGRLDVSLRQPVESHGVTVFYYPIANGLPPSFFYAPELARACSEQVDHADIAILETLWTHAMGPAVAACRRAGVPYLVPLRGQLLPWALRHRGLKKRIYLLVAGRRYLDGAAALHCTDEEEAAAAAALGLRAPTFVVPNPVPIADFPLARPRGFLRARFRLPPEARVVGVLGRLHPVKRPHLALEAVARVTDPSAHLVFMGPDEDRLTPGLRAGAALLGCAERVHFTGLLGREEVLAALADTDLLLMPSAMESFGMAAVEAMAAGVPVVASTGVAAGRWAETAGAGRVVPDTSEAFAAAIRELFGRKADLAAMGAGGRDLVRRRFAPGVVGAQMLEQLQAIVNTGRPLPAGATA